MSKGLSRQQPPDNSLHYGDCLAVIKEWPDEFIDLIYLDPPFNSKEDYNIIFRKKDNNNGNGEQVSQARAFTDTWKWDTAAQRRVEHLKSAAGHPAHSLIRGFDEIITSSSMLAYISYMAERLVEFHRILKPSGSLHLHCDPTASHYLKLALDQIFGSSNYRNEIIWGYRTGGVSKRYWPRKHDVILFYAKSDKYQHNPLQERIYYEKPFFTEKQDDEGRYYEDVYVRDVWDDEIKPIINVSKERLGFPTQKPIELLERIIRASSNEQDLVLDPFCGSGTTLEAAQNLKRKWLGIDVTPLAINLIKKERLTAKRFPGLDIQISGIPSDMASARKLASDLPFDFEKWAIGLVPGLAPNEKQTGDKGIDGRGYLVNEAGETKTDLVIVQVKGGRPTTENVRSFAQAIDSQNAIMGVFITLEKYTSPTASETAVKLGNFSIGAQEYPRLQFWSIEEYFDTSPPRLPWTPPMVNPLTGKSETPSLDF